MRIGIPREVKDGERRVALTPHGVASLKDIDRVFERGAGAGAGFEDAEYLEAGARIGAPWECELVVKVKELQPPEYARPRRGQVVLEGIAPGRVAILGAGNVGSNALAVAADAGAAVTVFAKSERRFAPLRKKYPAAVFFAGMRNEAILDADLVIGAVLTPGEEGVVHYCVPNMPAACPRTASLALELARDTARAYSPA